MNLDREIREFYAFKLMQSVLKARGQIPPELAQTDEDIFACRFAICLSVLGLIKHCPEPPAEMVDHLRALAAAMSHGQRGHA